MSHLSPLWDKIHFSPVLLGIVQQHQLFTSLRRWVYCTTSSCKCNIVSLFVVLTLFRVLISILTDSKLNEISHMKVVKDKIKSVANHNCIDSWTQTEGLLKKKQELFNKIWRKSAPFTDYTQQLIVIKYYSDYFHKMRK